MKTEELIAALAADQASVTATRGWAPARLMTSVLPVATMVVAGSFIGLAGIRSGMTSQSVLVAVGIKLAIALSMTGIGTAMALRLADPARGDGRGLWRLTLPGLLLLAACFADLTLMGGEGWPTRMIGSTGRRCVVLIMVLSVGPLAAVIAAVRQGATIRPTLAGMVAGLSAAGIGSSIYALNCTDDSPLFVALWYSLAAGLMAAIGATAGRFLLRW